MESRPPRRVASHPAEVEEPSPPGASPAIAPGGEGKHAAPTLPRRGPCRQAGHQKCGTLRTSARSNSPAESHRPSLRGERSREPGPARLRPSPRGGEGKHATPPCVGGDRAARPDAGPPTRPASAEPTAPPRSRPGSPVDIREEATPARHTPPAPAATVPPGREREARNIRAHPHPGRRQPHRRGRCQGPGVENVEAHPTRNAGRHPPQTPHRPCPGGDRAEGREPETHQRHRSRDPKTPRAPPEFQAQNPETHLHRPHTHKASKNPPKNPAPKTKTTQRPAPR